ncbi:aldo/keto reductase [Lentinus tigrinus ALCF2SS1-7]|uniref:Aldo/keto reductase n=1 Tax=Lentinus tigrinus ALCF2SS1-6 TaxID=1328759 RepID=A0A5C2SQX7_9APHY|nr:aldo/keto reductase [Lentinus tigrinus ALCF2SS1-6]RPD80206.1 aldo/keto reductase [Lentinus tigrinus ALCF2SS1-7]
MTIVNTAKIGDVTVGRIGHGLMMMTWRDPTHPLPDEDAFEAIKAGVDAMPEGVKMFLNSGEFYGPDASTANLELLSRFYAKYPEYAEKTFLSVKGGTKAHSIIPDGSPDNLRRSVDTINEKLGGIKKMDLFECARVPGNASIEEVIKTLAGLKDEGKFTHIGMSECSASTLRRGHSVHPIAVVEIEVSLWSYEEETKKVIATAKELGVAVAAYSPLGRGFLTGTIKSPKDLPAGDMRHRFTRFQEDVFNHNMALVEEVKSIAEKKGITPGQLALAWVASRGDHVIPIPGSSHKKRNLENIAAGDVELTPAELEEVDAILAKTPIKGGRYNDALDPKILHLWG